MQTPIITVENISKQYRLGQINSGTLAEDLKLLRDRLKKRISSQDDLTDARKKGNVFMALNDVSFTVNRGEAVGIIGGNGAGKSTLLKIISRITAPTSGRIVLNGRVASMLEVGTGFHGEMTGRENIYLSGAILGMRKSEIDKKIDDIIDFSECSDFIDTPVKRYSSGMFVKLAFAVIAHLDSEIMIMDEVLAVGDLKFQKKCLQRMGEEYSNYNKTILYVSHNMATIRQLCTRCLVLNEGRIIFDGDVDQAISLYAQSDKSKNVCQVYDLKEAIEKKRKIAFTGIELLEPESGHAKSATKCKFRISIYSFYNFSDIKIRAIVTNSHSIPVGMLVTDDIGLQKDEKKDVIFDVDLKMLSCDTYSFEFRLSRMYASFADDFDYRPNAVSLEIEDNDDQKKINWTPEYFGNVTFPVRNMTVEKGE